MLRSQQMEVVFPAVSWKGWFTLSLLVLLVVALARGLPTELTFVLALSVLVTAQVISLQDSLSGFCNSGILTVATLYVVAAGLSATGALDFYVGKLLGSPRKLSQAHIRLLLVPGAVSAFINNTPLVALMIPIISKWAAKINQPVSQLHLPMVYAIVLGGTVTLIGTSTNIVISSKAAAQFPNSTAGDVFALAAPGVPVFFWGLTYILLFAKRLLPGFSELARREARALGLREGVPEGTTDLLVKARVTRSSLVAGCSVHAAGLRHLREQGLFLASVERDGERFPAVGPEFMLREDDVLLFSGAIEDGFVRFAEERGLALVGKQPPSPSRQGRPGQPAPAPVPVPVPVPDLSEGDAGSSAVRGMPAAIQSHIVRALVREGSALAGKTPRDVGFREAYSATILSLARAKQGLALHSNLGKVELAVGDELLLLAGDDTFWARAETQRDLKQAASAAPGGGSGGRAREFFIPMRLAATAPLLGSRRLSGLSVEKAGLRGLPGVFLAAIERADGALERAVGRHTLLLEGDLLWFAGDRDSIAVLRRVPGIELDQNRQLGKLRVPAVKRRLVEVIVANDADLLGKTVRESAFRTRYEAAIVAVHRQGERVLSRIGGLEFRAGDVLVLEAGPAFLKRFRHDRNFVMLKELEQSDPPRFRLFYLGIFAAAWMIALPIAWPQYFNLLNTAVYAAFVLLATGSISVPDARRAVRWDIIITIACAFGLSAALEQTKMALWFSQCLLALAQVTNTGFVGVLTCVYIATSLISLVLTHNATALITYPIGVGAAKQLVPSGQSPDAYVLQMVFVLMFASSASWASPYSYSCNLMVFDVGHYELKDYLKFGGPMHVWMIVGTIFFVHFHRLWYVWWPASLLLFALAAAAKVRTEPNADGKLTLDRDSDDIELALQPLAWEPLGP